MNKQNPPKAAQQSMIASQVYPGDRNKFRNSQPKKEERMPSSIKQVEVFFTIQQVAKTQANSH